jgi:hypothetical protein
VGVSRNAGLRVFRLVRSSELFIRLGHSRFAERRLS